MIREITTAVRPTKALAPNGNHHPGPMIQFTWK